MQTATECLLLPADGYVGRELVLVPHLFCNPPLPTLTHTYMQWVVANVL